MYNNVEENCPVVQRPDDNSLRATMTSSIHGHNIIFLIDVNVHGQKQSLLFIRPWYPVCSIECSPAKVSRHQLTETERTDLGDPVQFMCRFSILGWF